MCAEHQVPSLVSFELGESGNDTGLKTWTAATNSEYIELDKWAETVESLIMTMDKHCRCLLFEVETNLDCQMTPKSKFRSGFRSGRPRFSQGFLGNLGPVTLLASFTSQDGCKDNRKEETYIVHHTELLEKKHSIKM